MEITLGLVVRTLRQESTLINDSLVGTTGSQVGRPELRERAGRRLNGSRGTSSQGSEEVAHLEGDGGDHGSRGGESNEEAGDLHID